MIGLGKSHSKPDVIRDDLDPGDDAELVDCLRAGAERCYELFVRRFGALVLGTARRYLRSDADAADCFQDTFLATAGTLAAQLVFLRRVLDLQP
jgi:hypothetical protein